MEPVNFPEQTINIAKNQPQYLPIPAHVFNDECGRIAFCWRLTWKERFKILFHGLIWHEVLTFGQKLQPQKLSADKPDMTMGE